MDITEEMKKFDYKLDVEKYTDWHWTAITFLSGYNPNIPIGQAWDMVNKAWEKAFIEKYGEIERKYK